MSHKSTRRCDCGKAIRRLVPPEPIDLSGGIVIDVPAHFCLQCSPEHCSLRAYCLSNGATHYRPIGIEASS